MLLLSGCNSFHSAVSGDTVLSSSGPTTPQAPAPTPTASPDPAPAPAATPAIKRIFVVLFENTNSADAVKQPFMKSLIPKGAYLNNYHAIGHPSEPNYIALIAGDPMGVTDDGNYNINGLHLGDLLEAKGRTWKAYLEDYPGNCYLGPTSATYVRKHNPFISFTNIQNNPSRCKSHLVSSSALDTDLAANQMPDYAMYVPGMNSDGHDTGVAFADNWLKTTFAAKLQDPRFMDGTLFIITFDENDAQNDTDQNKVYTLLLGASAKAAATSNALYDHYSLLRLVEDTFTLGNLGRRDASASPVVDVWK